MAGRNLAGRIAALEAAKAPPEVMTVHVTRRIVGRAENGELVELSREKQTITHLMPDWIKGKRKR